MICCLLLFSTCLTLSFGVCFQDAFGEIIETYFLNVTLCRKFVVDFGEISHLLFLGNCSCDVLYEWCDVLYEWSLTVFSVGVFNVDFKVAFLTYGILVGLGCCCGRM